MREEDKTLMIETYQNLVSDLDFGAQKLKEAGNLAFAHQLEDTSASLQKNIAALQGKIKYEERSAKEYLEAFGEWLINHRQDFYHAAEILALGFVLGKVL